MPVNGVQSLRASRAVAGKDIGFERVGLARLHLAEVLGHGTGAVRAAEVALVRGQPQVAVARDVCGIDGVEVAETG